MSFRRIATGVALALAGVVAAVGIGLLANTISGDSVGLGAEPLSAGETLAPPDADDDDDRADERRRERTRERREERRDEADEVRTTDSDELGDIAPPTTGFEDDDNSGSGSDDSGSDDSGSDDSGSDDSGSDDSGGDDSGRGRGRGRGRGGDDD